MTNQIKNPSPHLKARLAGALYFFGLLAAMSGEALLRGRLSYAAGEIAVAGMAAMTLLLYFIFKPVHRNLSLLAASFNFVALAFEALRWNPRGIDIALAFVGLHHLVIGYLIVRSMFIPRILSVSMTIAGLSWLTYLSPLVANHLSPYNTSAGLFGEGLFFLWLLVMGVNIAKWQETASAWRGERSLAGVGETSLGGNQR